MNLPSVCIVGAGAIGTTIGARLSAAGHVTSALARGRTLAALRSDGWRLLGDPDGEVGEVRAPVIASDDPHLLGTADIVVVAVKGQALPGLAPRLGPLIGPDTTVLGALNGVPWWFFAGIGGPAQDVRLTAVDPDGTTAAALPPARTVGCVVHLSAEVPEPGVGRLNAGNRLIVGDAVPSSSGRAAAVAKALGAAGFETELAPRIHDDLWFKLWGNLTMNPLSALTGATTDRILDDDLVTGFVRAAMDEAAAVGDAIGCPVPQSADDRIAITRGLGRMRTSMLQDADAGRQLELDPLVGAVQELGRRFGVPTPSIDTLLGLTRLAARTRGLYPDPPP